MPQSLLSVQPPQLNGMDRVFVEGATPTTLQCVKLKSIPAQRDITHCTRRMGQTSSYLGGEFAWALSFASQKWQVACSQFCEGRARRSSRCAAALADSAP